MIALFTTRSHSESASLRDGSFMYLSVVQQQQQPRGAVVVAAHWLWPGPRQTPRSSTADTAATVSPAAAAVSASTTAGSVVVAAHVASTADVDCMLMLYVFMFKLCYAWLVLVKQLIVEEVINQVLQRHLHQQQLHQQLQL